MPNRLSRFWQELVQRRVLYFLIGYVTACFAIIEFLNNASDSFSIPERTIRLLYLLAAIGLPAVIILPWVIYRKQKRVKRDNLDLISESAFKDKSIIVLPFENLSPDPDQEYFSDGLTEEIISDLSCIDDLLVISRSSAMTFKGSNKTLKQVANEVGVRYLLEGSVRKSDNNIRIVAQLIDGTSDTHIWAEKYKGTLEDIFNIQEKVSRSIADALRIRLSAEESVKLSRQSIHNLEVYEYYLKARQEIYRLSKEGLDRAIQYLERGLQIEVDSPLLYSCMGNAYFQYWNLGIRMDDSYLAKARDCADRIFQVEPGSPHGRMILGLLQSFSDPPEAIREFELVLASDPMNEDALLWLCLCHLHLGLSIEAHPLIEWLVRKDPLNSIIRILPGLRFYYRGELEHALESLEKAYQSDQSDPLILWHYGRLLASANHTDRAIAALDKCVKMGRFVITRFSQLLSLALQNKKQDVVNSIDPDLEYWAKKDWLASLWLAECLSLVGEDEKALKFLKQAVDMGGINFPFLTKHDPFLTSIRDEPRFRQIVHNVEARYLAAHERIGVWLEENKLL
jgi:TolB-like protein